MANEKILIVEDDKHISKLVKYNLEKAGYHCVVTITGEDALNHLDSNPVDVIIMDIMLPKMDGFELCKQVRQDKNSIHTPIIMLTARGEEVDRVVGFELGADDYIVKPFSPRELALRVKALLKRGKVEDTVKDILSVANIKIDIPRHQLSVNEKNISLTPTEFKLLVTLIQGKGRVQSRDFLLDKVWGITADVTTRTVDTHIKFLRQKLGKAGQMIETIRGIGYRISDEE